MDENEQRARIAVLEAALRDADAALLRDRTGLAKALGAIVNEVQGRLWVSAGRGCYDWDDDRYKEEAGEALRMVLGIAQLALLKSGSMVIPALQAIDAVLEVRAT